MASSFFQKDPNGGLAHMAKTNTRPEGMDYKGYSDLCKGCGLEATPENEFNAMEVVKSDSFSVFMKSEEEPDSEQPEMSDSEVEEDEDEATDEVEEAEKSMADVTASDLMKSIESYGAIEDAMATTGESRESYLTARLDSGTISKSERSELGKIWAGIEEEPEAVPMQKSLASHISEDEDAGHLVDASDFLKSLVQGVDFRMDQVLGEVSRDGRATRELMKAQGGILKSMATVIAEQDSIIKSLTNRVSTVESAPVGRRSVVTERSDVRSRELAKSTVGGVAHDNLSKSQITNGLRTLMVHAADNSDTAAMDRMTHATALYEQTGSLPNNIAAAIRQVV